MNSPIRINKRKSIHDGKDNHSMERNYSDDEQSDEERFNNTSNEVSDNFIQNDESGEEDEQLEEEDDDIIDEDYRNKSRNKSLHGIEPSETVQLESIPAFRRTENANYEETVKRDNKIVSNKRLTDQREIYQDHNRHIHTRDVNYVEKNREHGKNFGKSFNYTERNEKILKKPTSIFNRHYILCGLAFICAAIAIGFYLYPTRIDSNPIKAQNDKKICEIDKLKSEFPNQSAKLWRSLRSGIEMVLNNDPTHPSIFLLAYEDRNTVKHFTKKIAGQTSECMTMNEEPLILNKRNLTSNEMLADYGVAIQTYKSQLVKSGVMLVSDLNQIPAPVAQALHVFCDTISPLVARSVIYMTLSIQANKTVNVLENVEIELRNNWGELENNVLEPLIARITDQVFFIKTENIY